jgi:hypothetical protein
LLASVAFGTAPNFDAISVEGIEHITADDIAFASEFGFRIKLLGVARRVGDAIDQKVHPAMVKVRTPLANVSGAANGVMVDAGEAGSFFFSGRGAGEAPTASAVIADIVEAASGAVSPVFGRPAASLLPLKPADGKAAISPWYLRFEVLDVPGVLAAIAGVVISLITPPTYVARTSIMPAQQGGGASALRLCQNRGSQARRYDEGWIIRPVLPARPAHLGRARDAAWRRPIA